MNKRLLIYLFLTITGLLNSAVTSDASETTSPAQQPAQVVDWQGLYTFGEVGGKNTGMVIDYSIKVYQQNGGLVADLDGDGFQTQMRIFCAVQTSANKIQFFFKGYRKDNLFEIYKPGERLLSLEIRNGKLLTYWGAVKPQLAAYKNGRVYFTKQTRRHRAGK